MLRAIEIENFKAFGQRVRAELAPITLVYGQNSSGKSSLLNAIRWLGQNPHILSPGLARSNGRLADLGSFRALLFNSDDARNPQLMLELEARDAFKKHALIPKRIQVLQTYKKRSDSRGLMLKSISFKDGADASLLAAVHIEDGPDINIYNNKNTDVRVCGEVGTAEAIWQDAHQYFQEHSVALLEWLKSQQAALHKPPPGVYDGSSADFVAQATVEWSASIRASIEFYSSPRSVHEFAARMNAYASTPFVNRLDFDNIDDYKRPPEVFFAFKQGRNKFSDKNKELICSMSQLLDHLTDQYQSTILSLRSLGSIRAAPLREYRDLDEWVDPDDDDLPSIGLNGEKWPLAVYRWSGGNLEAVNKWLGRLGSHHVLETRDIREEEPRLFEIRAKSDVPDGAGGRGAIDVNWADIGYGICQFVPIIVLAQHTDPRINLLEQPELHVHPQMQVEMAELFIDGYLTHGHQFIIETHSEHLLLRIIKAIRQRRLKSSDVSILFVERGKSGEGSTVRQLELDPDGEFKQAWPRGFMAERLDELA